MTEPAPILVEGLTVRDGGALVFTDVSLSVPRGSIYALLGRAEMLAILLDCLRGRRKPEAGRVRLLGADARARWRLRSRRLFVPAGVDAGPMLAKRPGPQLLLLEDPESAGAPGWIGRLRALASAGTTIFLTTRHPEPALELADQVGILARGRLVAGGPPADLMARFRRIRYVNRVTDTRTDFGTELDEFDAVRVRVRGWGIEAVVSNFRDEIFERFCGTEGVTAAGAEPMTLPEIFEAYGGTSG